MPPRKSNVSQASAPGDDGTPAKEREGINIEVSILPKLLGLRYCPHTLLLLLHACLINRNGKGLATEFSLSHFQLLL